MLRLHILFRLGLFLAGLFLTSPGHAVLCKLDLHKDGTLHEVDLPLPYYESKPGDRLRFVYEGAFDICGISSDSKEVSVIGYLNPCLGIFVTDGKKLLAFHKNFWVSVKSMVDIIHHYLDTSQKDNLHARIFATKAQRGDVNQKASVQEMRLLLKENIGIPPKQIRAQVYAIEAASPLNDTHYKQAQLCVAARLDAVFEAEAGRGQTPQIQLNLIDPALEGLWNKEISFALHPKELYFFTLSRYVQTKTTNSTQAFFVYCAHAHSGRKVRNPFGHYGSIMFHPAYKENWDTFTKALEAFTRVH